MRTIHLPALLAVLLGPPACVVPAGPQWTDPPDNVPPTIRSAVPPVGTMLGLDADGGGSLDVEVVLADQNTRDKLYTRFIIDYPPFVEVVSHIALQTILPPGSLIERTPLRFEPNCSDDQIARGFSIHRLLLAVSDRPFASDDPTQATPDQISNGFLVEGVWPFELDCQ
jgi:hypothetical protein